MKILTEIGPDALINTFVVNFKDKKLSVDINAVNDLQSTIFNELTGTAETKVGRTPMFLTTSTFNADHYGEALMQFKERLGVNLALFLFLNTGCFNMSCRVIYEKI